MGTSRCRPPPNSACLCSGRVQLAGPKGACRPSQQEAGRPAGLPCLHDAPAATAREAVGTAVGLPFRRPGQAEPAAGVVPAAQGRRAGRAAGRWRHRGAQLPPRSHATSAASRTLVREDTRESLTAAADLYRGRFMDDIAVSEEGWTEWLTGERQRLEDMALGALVRLGEQELAAGRPAPALEGRPARRRAQQHARRCPPDDRAGAGRIGAQGRSPQALRRPGRAAPARAEHRARCRDQGARCQTSRRPADRRSSAASRAQPLRTSRPAPARPAFDRGAALRQHEQRPGAGLLRRRHRRGHSHRALARVRGCS